MFDTVIVSLLVIASALWLVRYLRSSLKGGGCSGCTGACGARKLGSAQDVFEYLRKQKGS